MQFILKVFRNFADVILSFAFLALNELIVEVVLPANQNKVSQFPQSRQLDEHNFNFSGWLVFLLFIQL